MLVLDRDVHWHPSYISLMVKQALTVIKASYIGIMIGNQRKSAEQFADDLIALTQSITSTTLYDCDAYVWPSINDIRTMLE